MVHTAAVATGIVAGGVDLTRTDLGFVFEVTRGLYDGLDVRGVDSVIPAFAGQVFRNRVPDRRFIDAEGIILAVGAPEATARTAMATALGVLDALMRPDQDPYVIVVTLMGGGTKTINARPLGWDPVPGPVPTVMRGVLHWLSVDPDWT